MLSDACRAELKMNGFDEFIPVHICSECGKPPGEMDRNKPHPHEERLKEAIKRSKNPRKDDEVKRISRNMYNSSRCCGAPLKKEFADYFDVLWQKWVKRKDIPHEMIHGSPIDGVPNLRFQYGPYERYVDDDFIVMHYLLGLSDARVGDLIRIFRSEDTRQLEAAN